MRAFLAVILCTYTGCAFWESGKPEPIGWMDGTVACCTITHDSSYYTTMQCGRYTIERVTNYVRIGGECAPQPTAKGGTQ